MTRTPLLGRTVFLYTLTALSFIGTIALFIVLFTSTHRVCDSIGCQNVADDHLPAWITLVAGAIQTALLGTIALMCQTLGEVVAKVGL